MADKKPSMYSNRGEVGSAEELEAYGVWVKSEPQDFTASLAGAVNFDAETVPFDAGFGDTGYDDLNIPEISLPSLDQEDLDIPEMSIESNNDADSDIGGFDDESTAQKGLGSEAASTQLLMRIADELSSIRSELSTLKKEFVGIRSGSSAAKADAPSGFFSGEDEEDERIALTGEEMESFLTSTDFPETEDLNFDSTREADEAALKELAEQNESPAAEETEEATEEINIDFDNLGIDLASDLEMETESAAEEPEGFPSLEAATEDDFASTSLDEPSFGDLSSDETSETAALEAADQEAAVEPFTEELGPLEPLEEDEELRDIRLEGAIPLTPAPDNTSYLEADPFILDDSGHESASVHETALTEEPVLEEAASEEPVLEEPVLEEAILEGDSSDVSPLEEPVLEETSSEETVSDASSLTKDTALEDLSFSDDADLSFGDDVSFDLDLEDISTESAPTEEETGSEKAEESTLDLSQSLTETAADEPVVDEPAVDEPAAEEPAVDETELSAESLSGSEDVPSEAETGDEEAFDAGPLDLSDAVIDEPDLSAGIVEAPLEEPVLSDISFKDDISLDMDDFDLDDFGTDLDLSDDSEPEKAQAAASPAAATAGSAAGDIDDSIAQVIPEGFEANAKEADIPLDEDLEALTDDDLSIVAGETSQPGPSAAKTVEADTGDDPGISANLKTELKSVLSYMDRLLESLPEEKIEEFAKSEYFDTYKKIFKELGLE